MVPAGGDAVRSVGSICGSAHGRSPDTNRHSATNSCSPISSTIGCAAIGHSAGADTADMRNSATAAPGASATASVGLSRKGRKRSDSDNERCRKREGGST